MTSIATQIKTHPRGYMVESDGTNDRGKRRFRAQIKDLAVGDTLAEFGKILEWSEVERQGGYRMFRMVTEHPQHYPETTNVFVRAEFVYYGITALAEPQPEPKKAKQPKQPKLSPAQEKALLSGLANTQTRVLEGRPVTNRSLVNLGYAYHAPTFMQYKLTEAGIARAEEIRAAQRAEQFKKDAAAVEEFRPEGTRPVYARDVKVGMLVHDGIYGLREVFAVQTYEEGPYKDTHWTRITLSPTKFGENDYPQRVSTSNPDHIRFVDEAEEEPQPRPSAEVLADDPIPSDTSVLEGMPGKKVGRDGVPIMDALTHEAYVVQVRSGGKWVLPNHDDGAHMTREQVISAMARVRRNSAGTARAAVDEDGTVYLSNGYQAARYIPVALFADYSADRCPGCSTPYATNGDGPCEVKA